MFSIFGYKIGEKHILTAIILLAAILRFWGLGSSEIFHDEGFYAFRSIGYADYIQNDDQTTPIQWFKDIPSLPWWIHLSFHDHPPLFFLIQNIFFRIFGDSLFSARLPSVLAGLGAIYLAYLIGKRLFHAGLLVALLLAVNHIHIWISRSSILESLQIFFIFLNIYYFFVFLENPKKWEMFGLTLGLAFLTKYTSAFLVPVYFSYLVLISIFGSSTSKLKDRRLYAAFGLALLLFSPVLIYNFYLWKTVGHFDLQFSYLFRQETPEWRASLGKTQEPFSNLFGNLTLMYSIPFLLAATSGIIYSLRNSAILFWLLSFIFITFTFIPVGSAFRFITLYVPPFIFFAGAAIYFFSKKLPKKIFLSALGIFLAYELYFAVDGIFLTFPDLGVTKLDDYLEQAIGNERSRVLPRAFNPHLDKIIQTFGKKRPPADLQLAIVYDENIALSAKIWLFTRRLYYRGILTLTAGQFKTLLKDQGPDAFNDSRVYFVRATEDTSLNTYFNTPDAEELEEFLQSELKLNPEKVVYGKNDLPMFRVYNFLFN